MIPGAEELGEDTKTNGAFILLQSPLRNYAGLQLASPVASVQFFHQLFILITSQGHQSSRSSSGLEQELQSSLLLTIFSPKPTQIF